MTNHKLPQNWEEKDIREVIPESLIPNVSDFCKEILKESKKPGFDSDTIAHKAKKLLEPHKTEFEEVGTDTGFFAYWLQNAWNLGQYAQMIEVLKKKLVKTLSLDEVLPPEGVSTLQIFVENCNRRTLIVEDGKTYATLMLERVLEPYRNYIISGKEQHGITDLNLLALALCKAANIPATEYPS
jgi:hypothetical protein